MKSKSLQKETPFPKDFLKHETYSLDELKNFVEDLFSLVDNAQWGSLTPIGIKTVPVTFPNSLDYIGSIRKRLGTLARDPAHQKKDAPPNKITQQSIREAIVSIAAEASGQLKFPIIRDQGGRAEVIDGNQILWDVKKPRSPGAEDNWEIKIPHLLKILQKEFKNNENVLFDLCDVNEKDCHLLLDLVHQSLSTHEYSKVLFLLNKDIHWTPTLNNKT